MLSFVDDQGRTLKQQAVRLTAGQGTFVALDFNEAAQEQRGRLHYRAVVTPLNDGCTAAIAGHEMINNADEKTTVFIGVYQE
jgi:predicted nucleic acid-binding protein